MLAIRMQRTGRKGHAMFRLVVQESRLTPTSGKVVARLGNYDPHAKNLTVDKEKASFYLSHGAQPSDRVARLLKADGVELPSWVRLSSDKTRTVKTPEKRRSTSPVEPEEVKVETPEAKPTNEEEPTEPISDTIAEDTSTEISIEDTEKPTEKEPDTEKSKSEQSPEKESETTELVAPKESAVKSKKS